MSLKQTIKTKICVVRITPNFPLKEFVLWAADLDKHHLLTLLDEIQAELDAEELAVLATVKSGQLKDHHLMRGYWSMYCAEIRDYYRAVIRNPDCESGRAFLFEE